MRGEIKKLYSQRRSAPKQFYGEYHTASAALKSAFTCGVINAFLPLEEQNCKIGEINFLKKRLKEFGGTRHVKESMQKAFDDGMAFAETIKIFEDLNIQIPFEISRKGTQE